MRFQQLDDQMRRFETINDPVVSPDQHVVLRLDGKGFTSMCAKLKLARPFDHRFTAAMQETAKMFLTHDSFKASYVYVQSDEISVLMPHSELAFNGKIRKFNSIGASLAAVTFNNKLSIPGDPGNALFDCRVIQLPTSQHVVDYFKWRQADADRNCLNTTCHWNLIQLQGLTASQAAKRLHKASVAQKYDILHTLGINYEKDTHNFYRYGSSFKMGKIIKEGFNPIKQETVKTERNVVVSVDVREDVRPDNFVIHSE